jgi:xanthine dehydrogenase iron-sulfur cluster and FAD-binding subunit A
MSGHQHPGWNPKDELHPLQRAFIETGAIQSGYDTPALILAGKSLLDRNPNPTEAEVRDAISGIVSRETGHAKPVQAILLAAKYMQDAGSKRQDAGSKNPNSQFAIRNSQFIVVGQSLPKVDAPKLAQGRRRLWRISSGRGCCTRRFCTARTPTRASRR